MSALVQSGIDRVLSIDPASRMGWAALVDGELTWGVEQFEGDFLAKLNAFSLWVTDAIQRQIQPALIAIERPGFMPGLDAKLICGGMQRLVEARAKTSQTACLLVTDSAWKKGLGLKRRVSNDEYVARVRALGFGVGNADEAAAVGILLEACRQSGTTVPLVVAGDAA